MSHTAADHTITVYSDYVCPFCYLGAASLETYLDSTADPPAVTWQPFDLRHSKRSPDGELRSDVDDGKDDAYFEQVRENVQRLADEYGVEMNRTVAREVDSWNAQKVGVYVQREAGEAAAASFREAVFEALWVHERDIGDPAVLADLAEAVGLPSEEVLAAIDDPELDAILQEQVETAQRRGVTGIPTFVYGEHVARGAVPPSQLGRLVGDG